MSENSKTVTIDDHIGALEDVITLGRSRRLASARETLEYLYELRDLRAIMGHFEKWALELEGNRFRDADVLTHTHIADNLRRIMKGI